MRLVGLVGSPHRDGYTAQLVSAVLEEAARQGAQTDVVFALDHSADYCRDCPGKTCWSDQQCRRDDEFAQINELISTADALVLAASVYFLAPNAMARNLMDHIRTSDRANGIPALAISMAGGTGKGSVLAARCIDDFFFCHGMRALEALPVTRFNFASSLEAAKQRAAQLVQTPRKPFADNAERIAYFSGLRFARFDMVAENLWLAEQIVENTPEVESTAAGLAKARTALEQARVLLAEGRRDAAAAPIVHAYEAAVAAWHSVPG